MVDMEVRDLHQDAVYWAPSGTGNYGKATLAAGIALKVRWEKKNEEILDSFGKTIGTEATVVVDRDLLVGGILWEGKIADLPVDVTTTTDLKKIVSYKKIPDVKNRAARRVARLIKHSDKLPTLA